MSNKIPTDLQWADLANKVKAKADSSDIPSAYGASLELTMDNTTYVLTAALKDQNGNTLGAAQTVDLPLESVVVSGSYDATTKKVVLTLKDGSTIDFSVADLIDGLQSEITAANKLNADLVDDGDTANKFVSSGQLAKLDGMVEIKSIGANLSLSAAGELSATGGGATIPIATADTLGGVKIGNNLTIDSSTGVLSADAQVEEFTAAEWSGLWA